MNPAATVDTAARLGNSSTSTVLAFVCLVLCGVVVWLWRDTVRLNKELLAAHVASGADKERLLTVQVTREGSVSNAMQAITALPDVVRALPDAVADAVGESVRDVVREELTRERDARRGR